MTPKSMHRVRLSPPYFLFFRKFSILFLCCQVFFEEGILPLRFAQKKEGILRSLTLPQNDRIKKLSMIRKETQNDGKRSAEWLGKEAQYKGRGIEKKGENIEKIEKKLIKVYKNK